MAGPSARGARSPRNIETRKKKARRAIPRKPVTTSLGNTIGARLKAKKAAGKRLQAKAKAVKQA